MPRNPRDAYREGFLGVLEKSGFLGGLVRGAMPQVLAGANNLADQGFLLVERDKKLEELQRQRAEEEKAEREEMMRQYGLRKRSFDWRTALGAGALGVGAGVGGSYLWGKRKEKKRRGTHTLDILSVGSPEAPIKKGPDEDPMYITEEDLARMYAQAAQAQHVFRSPDYPMYY